jgi:superfamily I DNA/RNA helicase
MEERRLQKIMKPEANYALPWFEALNWPQEMIDYTRTLVARKPSNLLQPKINISTIHSIKGGEADNVYILSDITKNVKDNMERNPDSEHRVFYVGVTRAKNSLRLVLPQTKLYYDFN